MALNIQNAQKPFIQKKAFPGIYLVAFPFFQNKFPSPERRRSSSSSSSFFSSSSSSSSEEEEEDEEDRKRRRR